MDAETEMHHRQYAADLINIVGKRLNETLQVICSAVKYMDGFYKRHSFTEFRRPCTACACLYISIKNAHRSMSKHDQGRISKHIIQAADRHIHNNKELLDISSVEYRRKEDELLDMEVLMLETIKQSN